MSDNRLVVRWTNPQQANVTLHSQIVPFAKPLLLAGHQLVAEIRIAEDQRSIQQNKFYWKACLEQISQQAKLDGVGFQPEGWHWYMKRKFLGYRFKKVMIPGNKRVSIIRELRSTTGLSVKKMSDYLDKVQAHAAQDLGVEFKDQNWQQWTGIDMDTGEITYDH